jgi:hypothetical protein
MNQVWLQIFAVMIVGNIVKEVFSSAVIWVLIDLAIFAVVYWIISRYPYIDSKKSMFYLGILTLVSILVDIGFISGIFGNIIVLALLFWMLFGGGTGGGRRPIMRHKWHK